MTYESDSFSNITNLTSNENVMVFAEVNYSSDDSKTFDILASSDNDTESYIEAFSLKGVSIENYNRIEMNHTTNILMFDVFNNWYTDTVNWSLTDPDLANSTALNTNESVMVIIEENYSQGNK